MSFKIIYTADLHGNKVQYIKLFDYAKKINADAIIIGGDITPKDKELRTIKLQRKFLLDFLLPQIEEFNKINSNRCDIFIIMGNDDFKANYEFLKTNENGYKVLDEKPFLWNNYILLGYTYVPYTPFIYKDWEKADLIDKKELDRTDIRLKGIKSTNDGFIDHTIDLKQREDSIERDMLEMTKNIDLSKTILVTHSPPYGTASDTMHNNRHIGSEAIKKTIIEKQPLLTLHGHIHECFKLTGKFLEEIGNTITISPGNDHIWKKLAIIEIDLDNIKESKRIIL